MREKKGVEPRYYGDDECYRRGEMRERIRGIAYWEAVSGVDRDGDERR